MAYAVGAIAIVLVTGGVAPAAEAKSESHASEIAQLISQVRPQRVTNERVTPGGGATAHTGGTVNVPDTSSGQLTVTGTSGAPISVVLPGAGTQGTTAPDGTVVYGEEAGLTIAVQSGAGQARVHTVMKDRHAVEGVRYVFPDLAPELNPDGSVTLLATSADGAFQASVGYIAAPWAADARGRALPTAYRVAGRTLIQDVVVNGNTAFPVVSDPAFQGDCGYVTCTIRFDRAWTKRMRDYGGDFGLVEGAVVTAASAVGGPVGAAVGAAAGVIVGVRAHMYSTQAGDFYANGNCFGIKFPAGVPGLGWGTQVTWGTYNCA